MNNLKKILKEISKISFLLFKKGWAEKNAGNLSIDITEIYNRGSCLSKKKSFPIGTEFKYLKNHYFLFTKSGSKFRDIAEDPLNGIVIIKINSQGNGYSVIEDSNSGRPTSEILSHLLIQNYLRKIDAPERVILHSHPTEIISLSHIKKFQASQKINKLLTNAHPEVSINLPDKIGFIPYIPTGTMELAEATLTGIQKGRTVIIWERHGALAIARDLTTAFDHLDIVNKAALIVLQLLSTGITPSSPVWKK